MARNYKKAPQDPEDDSLMQDSILRSNSKESGELAAKSPEKEYLPSIKESKLDLTEESSRRKSIEEYAQEAILLDENDPIRKLQKYFGGASTPYEDGRDV